MQKKFSVQPRSRILRQAQAAQNTRNNAAFVVLAYAGIMESLKPVLFAR